MSKIFGALTHDDNEYNFLQTTGQQVVYKVAEENVAMHNADMEAATSVFVSGITTDFKERYKLPGGGRMQRRNKQSRPGVSKTTGSWDVAFPLEDFMEGFSGNDVDLAYTSARELELHFETAFISNRNTMRFEILKRLFNNTQTTFTDEYRGSLLIEPLANGDGVVYPPIMGSETEATEDHYVGSNYLYTAIDDTNNPLPTIEEDLTEHFGDMTGGNNIVVFCNPQETPYLEALVSFDAIPDQYIRSGDNVDIPIGLPNVPGVIKGRSNGVWVVEWRWMPAAYLLGIHLEAEAPLKMRIDPDPVAASLGRGLTMVSENMDFPFNSMYWRNRYGIGTANRLNGFVMQLVDSTSYTIPTIYQ